jgi:hypothetical protein
VTSTIINGREPRLSSGSPLNGSSAQLVTRSLADIRVRVVREPSQRLNRFSIVAVSPQSIRNTRPDHVIWVIVEAANRTQSTDILVVIPEPED